MREQASERELDPAVALAGDLRDVGASVKDLWKQVATLRRSVDTLVEELSAARFSDLAVPGRRAILTDQLDRERALLEVLQLAGVDSRRFVDVGCGRSGGQSRLLADRFGWSGLFVDASPGAVKAVQRAFLKRPDVLVAEAEVTPENVNELIARLPGEPDLLSIDIDSYDYWLWRAVEARPRVVVVEYNAYFGEQRVVVPYGAMGAETPKGYFGASLGALHALGREKGYGLLGCDSLGVNAYFVRTDLLPESAAVEPEEVFRKKLVRTDAEDVGHDPRKILKKIRLAELPLVEV
ncbi:MAG TPA: hypothetical protein VFJ91_06160 [Gaiellaceae bacterium]|nr:hypothetical protein [Gaiellaceae bacterium]